MTDLLSFDFMNYCVGEFLNPADVTALSLTTAHFFKNTDVVEMARLYLQMARAAFKTHGSGKRWGGVILGEKYPNFLRVCCK